MKRVRPSPRTASPARTDRAKTGRHGAQEGADADEAPENESASDRDDDRDAVGYQRPPRQHRWQKGHSGNPSGRKKGSRNKTTIIIHLMEQKLGRRIDDLSKLTRYEAMLLKGIQKALTGDTKAMAFILRRYDDAAGASTAPAHITSEQDEIVYAALVDKIRRELEDGQ